MSENSSVVESYRTVETYADDNGVVRTIVITDPGTVGAGVSSDGTECDTWTGGNVVYQSYRDNGSLQLVTVSGFDGVPISQDKYDMHGKKVLDKVSDDVGEVSDDA